MRNKPLVYFGPADGGVWWTTSAEDFRFSFLTALLFQGDLAITDIFFFGEGHLWNLIEGRDWWTSLFSAALRRGAIVPVFRNGSDTTFQQAAASASDRKGFIDGGRSKLLDEIVSSAD